MKSQVKKLPKSQIEAEIEFSAEELDSYIKQATLKMGENLEIEGFRKGKASKDIVEKKVGSENILIEAADLAVKDGYRKFVLENKIEPIFQPEIDILKLAKGNPFIFKAKITILPQAQLPDYKKIAQKEKKVKVVIEDKEIEEALEWLRKSRAKFSPKAEPAKLGDFVEIEYCSSQIKEAKAQQPQKDAFILGEGHLIPGFEEALIGMKEGEEKKEVEITMPQNHSIGDLAGKKIAFLIKMNSVKTVEFPELNDQFIKSIGNFKDLKALRESIKEGIAHEKAQALSQRIRREILEKISKETKVEIPDNLVLEEQKRLMENLKDSVGQNLKISFEQYLKQTNKTEKEMLDSFVSEARNKVKNFLILREIGKKEEIKVSESEIKEEVNKILKQHEGHHHSKDDLDPERLRIYIEGALRNEKIFSLLEGLVPLL